MSSLIGANRFTGQISTRALNRTRTYGVKVHYLVRGDPDMAWLNENLTGGGLESGHGCTEGLANASEFR